MKFSVGNFLRSAAAIANGTMQGQIAGEQELLRRQALQQQQQQQELENQYRQEHLKYQRDALAQGQQGHLVGTLGNLLNSGNLSDEGAQYFGGLLQRAIGGMGVPGAGGPMSGLSAPTPPVTAAPAAVAPGAPQADRMIPRPGFRDLPPGPQVQYYPQGATTPAPWPPAGAGVPTPPTAPAAPSPAAAGQAGVGTPAPAGAQPGGLFVGSGFRQQGEALRQAIRESLALAAQRPGGEEARRQLIGIEQDFLARRITPDQGFQRLKTVPLGSSNLRPLQMEADRFQNRVYAATNPQSGTLKPEQHPGLQAIQDEIRVVWPPESPEEERKLRDLLAQGNAYLTDPKNQRLPTTTQLAVDARKAQNVGVIGARADQLLRQLSESRAGGIAAGEGPATALLGRFDQLAQDAKALGVEPPAILGTLGPRFSADPIEADGMTETPEEVRHRRLGAMIELFQSQGQDKEARSVARAAYSELFRQFGRGVYNQNPGPALKMLGDYAEILGLPKIPDGLVPGIGAEAKARLDQQVSLQNQRLGAAKTLETLRQRNRLVLAEVAHNDRAAELAQRDRQFRDREKRLKTNSSDRRTSDAARQDVARARLAFDQWKSASREWESLFGDVGAYSKILHPQPFTPEEIARGKEITDRLESTRAEADAAYQKAMGRAMPQSQGARPNAPAASAAGPEPEQSAGAGAESSLDGDVLQIGPGSAAQPSPQGVRLVGPDGKTYDPAPDPETHPDGVIAAPVQHDGEPLHDTPYGKLYQGAFQAALGAVSSRDQAQVDRFRAAFGDRRADADRYLRAAQDRLTRAKTPDTTPPRQTKTLNLNWVNVHDVASAQKFMQDYRARLMPALQQLQAAANAPGATPQDVQNFQRVAAQLRSYIDQRVMPLLRPDPKRANTPGGERPVAPVKQSVPAGRVPGTNAPTGVRG